MLAGILATVVQNDHDIIIELSTKMDFVIKLLENHLSHHFLYNLALLGAVGTLSAIVIKLLVAVRKRR